MRKQSFMAITMLALGGVFMLGLNGCSAGANAPAPAVQACNDGGPPTYNTNGSFDDNGAGPMPNNCSQNFGRRW